MIAPSRITVTTVIRGVVIIFKVIMIVVMYLKASITLLISWIYMIRTCRSVGEAGRCRLFKLCSFCLHARIIPVEIFWWKSRAYSKGNAGTEAESRLVTPCSHIQSSYVKLLYFHSCQSLCFLYSPLEAGYRLWLGAVWDSFRGSYWCLFFTDSLI